MRFPDHTYLEPDNCWDEDEDDPVDEDGAYDRWKDQQIMDQYEKEQERRDERKNIQGK